jgi:hypothetical protein
MFHSPDQSCTGMKAAQACTASARRYRSDT